MYQGLPMGISIAPDVFQYKTSRLFQYMVHIFVHMDGLAIIINDVFKNNRDILDDILNKLKNQEWSSTKLNENGSEILLAI